MNSAKILTKISNLPSNKRLGKIYLEPGRTLRPGEKKTVELLCHFGFDVICKSEINLPYHHNADIFWKNEIWEIKTITGDSRHTIKNNFRKAKRQSSNIIFDISTSRIKLTSTINKLHKLVCHNCQIKKILIIQNNKYCFMGKNTIQ